MTPPSAEPKDFNLDLESPLPHKCSSAGADDSASSGRRGITSGGNDAVVMALTVIDGGNKLPITRIITVE